MIAGITPGATSFIHRWVSRKLTADCTAVAESSISKLSLDITHPIRVCLGPRELYF